MLVRTIAAGVLCCLALADAPAAHACSVTEIGYFAMADEASWVAVGRIVPGGMKPDELLAGTLRRRVLRVRAGHPSSTCTPRMRRSRPGLVFLYADATLVGSYTGYVESPGPDLLTALRRYLGATDDAGRRAVLVEYATGMGTLAHHAALNLAERVDLLRSMPPSERARLVAAVPTADAANVPSLALVLARLHAIEAVGPLVARAGHVRYVEQVTMPLQLLTNHRQELGVERASESERWYAWRRALDHRSLAARSTGGPQIDSSQVAAEHWARWLDAHRGMNDGAIVAAGFRERGVSVPDLVDPRALASAIRTGPDALTRTFAWDRCELFWSRRLAPMQFSASGTAEHLWPAIASACETGVPYHY
jgi:hypothetical protein